MKGVNLGNWLVLEKWMSPELFDKLEAADETYFCMELGPDKCRERLKVHRDTYITSRDFCDMAAKGFELVRIPVPFFLFEDVGPYVHCYEYLDKAFDWAERYGMKILVDLHTVPGGQNGSDNAGLCGICQWSTKQEYVDFTEAVLEKIALRYGKREGMWGIEVLNEPMCNDTPISQYMNIQMLMEIYPPVDKEAARGNENYSLAFLKDFYRRAYRKIRTHMPADKCVVFHDAFSLDLWDDFFHEELFENIVLDTHQYLMIVEGAFPEKNLSAYHDFFQRLGQQISSLTKSVPVIVGEWCLSNALIDRETTSTEEAEKIYRQLSVWYQEAMKDSVAWFYWTWRIHTDDLSMEGWDASKAVNNCWLTI